MSLPPDNHVHSEWSWDTATGDMERTCERAVELGLPSVAFTEHVDFTVWQIAPEVAPTLPPAWLRHGLVDGGLVPPALDVTGYLEAIERCRARFPRLRILTGVELGEPHWHREQVAALLSSYPFERVLGSLHSAVRDDGRFEDVGQLYRRRSPHEAVAEYLSGIEELLTAYDGFQVLAHLDYVVRRWPAEVPYDPVDFEDQLRHVLGLVRDRGLVLEVNTRVPLHPIVLRWWHEVGGEAISFASDAHAPELVARGFADAAALAEACGFAVGRDPLGFWYRRA